jgi:hypothetical protein
MITITVSVVLLVLGLIIWLIAPSIGRVVLGTLDIVGTVLGGITASIAWDTGSLNEVGAGLTVVSVLILVAVRRKRVRPHQRVDNEREEFEPVLPQRTTIVRDPSRVKF